jgi:hypothetical protein
VPRSQHRRGRPWRRAKALMHAHFGYVCHLCGHSDAGEADHLVAVAVDPDQPVDWRMLRPSHGSNYPCPVCPRRNGKPRSCNQERGTKPLDQVFTPAHDW